MFLHTWWWEGGEEVGLDDVRGGEEEGETNKGVVGAELAL
jgi:hypothetical protein